MPDAKIKDMKRLHDDTILIYVECSYCKKIHIHGGGQGEKANLGYRAPHCYDARGEERKENYKLVNPDSVPIRKFIGGGIRK